MEKQELRNTIRDLQLVKEKETQEVSINVHFLAQDCFSIVPRYFDVYPFVRRGTERKNCENFSRTR